jgi:hypothetical protein
LDEVDGYLSSLSSCLVNYAMRYRATYVVTSVTEGAANFLIIGA